MHRILGALALAVALVVALPGIALASDDPFFDDQWNLSAIGAEAAWSRGRGAGTVIAIVDTGVDLGHEDLKPKLLPGRSFIAPGASPQDANGHGTHVAGIAAASTGNGLGVAGVAPDAMILPVQVLGSRGVGNVAAVADGIRYAADNGADVINLSFGEVSTDVDLAPDFIDAIRYAWAKGAIPVVASGNSFVRASGFTTEPAIVVTATTRSDTRPDYASGVGSAQWALAAPGGDGSPGTRCEIESGVVSTYKDDEYACLVGTSMAAPHVAGAAAVLKGLGMSQQQVVDQLLATADDVGAPGNDTTFGSGRLNLARAVQAAAPPPAAPFEPPPTTTTKAPAVIVAAPAPTTTEPPTTTTTEPATTTTGTTPSTISLPPTTAVPLEPPDGQAVALLPDDAGSRTARYVLAVPAALLASAVGTGSWRLRGQLAADRSAVAPR
ncbi:MAG: S8 family serine peptidase [Actinobacteria bacterium]|nr:S8 family serine peptidase [Actinomycetota bacterium]